MPNPWLDEHKSTAAMNYFLNIIVHYELWRSMHKMDILV